MATGSSESSRAATGRDMLDAPPRRPRLRNKPDSLGALSGRSASSDSDDLLNSPDGEMSELDPNESSELDSHPVVQAFDHYAQARGHLQIVGTLMNGVLAPVQDLITLLDQLIPQQGAAMLSGGAMGAASPGSVAGAPMQPANSGGPPMMGLQQLAGVGAGMPGGGGAPMMATPGAMM